MQVRVSHVPTQHVGMPVHLHLPNDGRIRRSPLRMDPVAESRSCGGSGGPRSRIGSSSGIRPDVDPVRFPIRQRGFVWYHSPIDGLPVCPARSEGESSNETKMIFLKKIMNYLQMTTPFAVAIKLFTVMAIFLFMSQIGSFTLPETQVQHHHPPSIDAS